MRRETGQHMGQVRDRSGCVKVLLVEDDVAYADLLASSFARLAPDTVLETVASVQGALELLTCRPVDILILDRALPDGDGLAVVQRLREQGSAIPFVLLTAEDSGRRAAEAFRAGAVDYLVKGARAIEETLEIVRSIGESGGLRESAAVALIGASPAMDLLRAQIARYAATQACVLILGETGVGKELVARALHSASPRSKAPFVAINCGALPEPLVEAELFGHARGAYTGAHAERLGLVEHARRGTLFLDEVEDLPPGAQGKLLRLIQEGGYRPLGTVHERSADVRIVAATNRDLEGMVAEGSFRRDLYYRLDVLRILVPPLRERLGDLPSLIGELIARRSSRSAKAREPQQGGAARAAPLPPELEVLRRHTWPGNVRELENVVERARAVAVVAGWRAGWAAALAGLGSREVPAATHGELQDGGGAAQGERTSLERVLTRNRWRRAEAARELGVSRVTLWRRMRRLGLAGDP